MADWPTRGQQAPAYWDDQLRAYIDDKTPAPTGLSANGRPLVWDEEKGAYTAASAPLADLIDKPARTFLQHSLPGGTEPETFIAWTMDDGYTFQTQHMAPTLAARGINCTLFLTQLWVDHAGTNVSWGDTYPTTAQVQAFADAGNELGEHGYNHEDKPSLIASLGRAGAQAFTEAVRDWIADTFNTTVLTGAYCAGLFDEASVEVMARSFTFYRATRGAVAYDAQNAYAVDSVPFDALTEAQMKAKVDDAIANKSLLVFSVHGVAPANYAAVAAKIAAVADYATGLGVPQGTFYEAMIQRTKRRGASGSHEDALGNAFHRRVKAYRLSVQRDDRVFGRHWWEYNETDDSSRFDGDSGFFEFMKPLRIAAGSSFLAGERSIFADGQTYLSTAPRKFTSATAAFKPTDVGRTITSAGNFPGGTTFTAYVSPVEMTTSADALTTASGLTFTIGRPTPPNAHFAGDTFFYGNTRIRASAPTLVFQNLAGTQTGQIAPTAWVNSGASGTGGPMLIDSGTGGSPVTVKTFRQVVQSQSGAAKMSFCTAAPTDASLAAGEGGIWFDTTPGAVKIKFKVKEADGTTIRTGEVALA